MISGRAQCRSASPRIEGHAPKTKDYSQATEEPLETSTRKGALQIELIGLLNKLLSRSNDEPEQEPLTTNNVS